jgi:hypothetical protein
MKKTMLAKTLLTVGMLTAALPAAEARGFRGGVFVGPVITPVYRPWGYWGPYGYPGYWGSGYYGGFGYPISSHPNAGQLKIDTKQKDAQVYINGAYAGLAKDMKSTWLKQGTYDLELRAPDGQNFATQIYVVSGKTMHIHPQMPADIHS